MMHTERTNRALLALFGLLLLAGGTFGALVSFGVFGEDTKHHALLANRVGAYFGDQGDWLWPAIAAGAAILALLALWWLWLLLFSTDRTTSIVLSGDRTAGRTTLTGSAITAAVSDEITAYAGVDRARARLLGDPASPRLVITATLEQTADLPALRRRIETEAAGHARQALDSPDLPIQLDLTITDRQRRRVA
jgi:hypothetical protein